MRDYLAKAILEWVLVQHKSTSLTNMVHNIFAFDEPVYDKSHPWCNLWQQIFRACAKDIPGFSGTSQGSIKWVKVERILVF